MTHALVSGRLALLAWLVATFGPLAVAVWFRSMADRLQPAWPFHVLFLPCALAVEWLSVALLFYAAGDDGSGPPGLGLALLPALFALVLAVAGYFVALVIGAITKVG